MSRYFRCSACATVFRSSISDEEAQAEAERDFPGHKPEDMDVLCDDCYEAFTTAMDKPH